ncbi:RpiB/LacA/LacB family sugar-phosphate isomerase [Ectobacillus funiculus]|uniref:RpiB/LacA/LacB family sugar-phosphate isomerase n=1 Tax=Ectobacillus funiculus TaxID=137993 RepID=UPI00397BF8A8
MKVAIASDHSGMTIRNEIISLMKEMKLEYINLSCECSTSIDYPDYAALVAEKIANGDADRGILIRGTGIRLSMAANKVKGIRSALVHDTFSKVTRRHNDINTEEERVISPGLACEIIKMWLTTPFEGGRHKHTVNRITAYEAIFE